MYKLFVKIAKAFLFVILSLILLLLIIGMIYALGWPWWTGFFVLVGVLGIVLAFIFLRKLLVRHSEKHFVEKIIEQDNARLLSLNEEERKRSQDLQAKWKEAVDALRRSHLKKRGNPLYVLPWYMVVGESGSGKTTAIAGAGLSSPFAQVSKTSGISGTRNCDWWFFEQAIILDTAGRYAIPIDEGRDKDEWQKFLGLMTKYRRKEPLNGLVTTISADKLLEGSEEELREDGRKIRRRIDELMLALGTKFPVYVLVTKCDLIHGMTHFCDQLPEPALSQAMGQLNHDFSKDAIAFLDRVVHGTGERLRDLRLVMLHYGDKDALDPSILLFPEELGTIRSGLSAFVHGAFQENPYQETPLLRGVFFSSGHQEGSPFSHFLKTLDLIEERDVLPGTNKGLFLHDLFARILPADRGLFAPTVRALNWGRLTRSLGAMSWLAIAMAVCGLLSFSFAKNLRTLKQLSGEFPQRTVLEGAVITDVVIMDRFRKAILRAQKQNEDWFIPRLGLNESQEVELELKEKYDQQFRKGLLSNLDQKLVARMASFSSSTDDAVLGGHVALLVRRINILKARLANQDLASLSALNEPPYGLLLTDVQQPVVTELGKMFSSAYVYDVFWNRDPNAINREMVDLQRWLKQMLLLRNGDLKWLVAWMNTNGALKEIRLGDFWRGSVPAPQPKTVPPAYTKDGKIAISSFLVEVDSALPDPGPALIAQKKIEFEDWYLKNYASTWEAFARDFSKGMETLQAPEEWRSMEPKVVDDQGPYFELLDRMAAELEVIKTKEGMPDWAKQVFLLKRLKIEASALSASDTKGPLSGVAQKGRQLIEKIGKGAGSDQKESVEYQLLAAKAYIEYRKALREMAHAAGSRKLAYETAFKAYNEDPFEGTSAPSLAYKAMARLKNLMGVGSQAEEPFWQLMGGPFDFSWTFTCAETACQLQAMWERGVLAEIQGIHDQRTVQQTLLGSEGLATRFVKGPAQPFLGRNVKAGYYPKEVMSRSIPFDKSFLSYLTRGATTSTLSGAGRSYLVTIEGIPTDVNPEAHIRPHATHLEIQCADKVLKLDNFQYPVRKSFEWSSASCGDVLFQIEVGDLVLTKKYTGPYAFPEFLRDFRSGQRLFYPSEFPKEQYALLSLGIRYIKVSYRFDGHRPVLDLLGAAPGKTPERIVDCWGR
jgi:type VI secretion system protein ImpL